ncbi:MAG: alpha/beta hydrolase [Eubacteriales bacterium]|nr:alpha/beta hydrolase [Eubacteriales bacterium]
MPLDPEVREFYKEKIENRSFEPPTYDIHILRSGADRTFNDKAEIEPIFCWEERVIERIPDSESAFRKPKDKSAGIHADPILDDLSSPDFPNLTVRIYYPDESMGLPVILYFHGGGFILHNVRSHDSLCRKLANTWEAVVVSCEYRLAPEYPYPAAVEDGCALFDWAKIHAEEIGGNPEFIYLSGDSAGASTAAAVSRMACITGCQDQIAGQILFYGTYSAQAGSRHSMEEFGGGDYVLPKKMADGFEGMYLPAHPDPNDPFLYPASGKIPENYPYTLLIRGEYDPLRDESVDFAQKLDEAGDPHDEILAEGMMHGFLLYWHKFSKVPLILEEAGRLLSLR